jgi:cytochrome c biogenesis protein CcmG, thiol:disulfide interchange protein DsbE
MIERTRSRLWTPGRRQLAALAFVGALLLGPVGSVRLLGVACADEPADSPLPEITPKELASRIRAAWAGYEKGLLEITFETTQNLNWRFMMNQGTAEEQKPLLKTFPGRARFLGAGRLWRVEYDSMMPNLTTKTLNPYGYRSGFDGDQLYGLDLMRNIATLGESTGGAENWRPREQFWHNGKSFADALDEPQSAEHTLAISQRTVDGVRCYVVERTYAKAGTRTEEVVSPRQGYLLLSTTWSRKAKPYHIDSLHDVYEVTRGIWAPRRIVEESRSVHDDGAEQLDHRTESRVVRYEPEKMFADQAFAFEPPYGVDVTDRRLGYSYYNDPWWPEAGALLRDRFDWPKSDLSPLSRLGSPAKFTGTTVPPISSADWINSKSLELAKLKGKVVLVEFWGTWCPPCRETIPAMRTLYETYRPAGLEIISIHTPTDDVNAVRRFVHEYRMAYPIAIDRPGKDGGVTSHAFGVTGYPCAFLVDHQGNVHSVGDATRDGGRLVQTLVPLLEKAGAKDVRRISLELPRISDEMEKTVLEALPTWIAAAAAKGTIRGRIVDSQGRPIAGARVGGSLKLTLLIFASPGGYQIVPYPRTYNATSGKDGRFEITGLTKGCYALKVEAPGRAWLERDVSIGPDFRVEEVEMTLDQGDAISGVVRDPDGRPIVGAQVDPTKWHHHNAIGGEVYTTPSGTGAARTGDDGRFQVGPLRHGSFTLEITAPGFTSQVMEKVPAGAVGLDVTLKRSKPSVGAKP